MADLSSYIQKPVIFPFRKLQMKRRQKSDGLYESSWFDITKFVERWGKVKRSIDDVRLNRFTHSGITLTVRNDYQEFNDEKFGASFFNGFLTRYRTLLRLQAGFTDGSGNQFPNTITQGIFVLDNEIDLSPKKNTVRLRAKSLISIFEDVRADEIDGITSSITASEIFSKIRDATDGSGNLIFRQFISSSSWNIESTKRIYTGLGTTTALAGFSTWEFMNKIAEAEAFSVFIDREGGMNFKSRAINTTSSQFSYFGAGFREPTIVKINSFYEAVNKLFTHFRFKYLEPDTSTSYVESGTQTTVSPNSLEWKYGRRTYELENQFFSDAKKVENVVQKLESEFSDLKNEALVDVLFSPNMEILDNIDISYNELSINSIHVWDKRNWAADTTASDVAPVLSWASETGSAIEFNQKGFKVLSIDHNLDTFLTRIVIREREN